jgi:putative hydrolase of the HAD superfamily
LEVLQYLVDKGYQLHLITNGFEKTQHEKLRSSGLEVFFKHVITSEGSNSLKPEKEIFEYALTKANANARESIMIGDTLDVDILGAINAGMDQVHVNFANKPQDLKPTYTITTLIELKELF